MRPNPLTHKALDRVIPLNPDTPFRQGMAASKERLAANLAKLGHHFIARFFDNPRLFALQSRPPVALMCSSIATPS